MLSSPMLNCWGGGGKDVFLLNGREGRRDGGRRA